MNFDGVNVLTEMSFGEIVVLTLAGFCAGFAQICPKSKIIKTTDPTAIIAGLGAKPFCR